MKENKVERIDGANDCHMCGREVQTIIHTSPGGYAVGVECGCHDAFMNGPRHEDMQNIDDALPNGFPDGWTAIMLDGMEYLD